jgi:ElaB/YqjD/DUF883 family membrane-anchored ribosome-binding protein
MGQDQGQVGTAVGEEQKTPDEIRRDIEGTREELGDTAAALAAKTDVKARAEEKVEDVKSKVQANPIPVIAVAAVVGGFLIWRIARSG